MDTQAEKSHEILKGFPQTNEGVISLGGQPSYSEGFIIRLFKKDGSSWIANLKPSFTSLVGFCPLVQENEILVFARGKAYVLDVESQKLIRELGSDYEEFLCAPDGTIIMSGGTDITVINANGVSWHSERISWDGFKNLELDGNIVSGLSYDLTNENTAFVPFQLDLKTMKVTGGSYLKYELIPIPKSNNVPSAKGKPWWKFLFSLFKKPVSGIDKILEIKDPNEKVVALHSFCNQHYKIWTETEKTINAVLDMEGEVMSGGFLQYFQNSASNQWKDALGGLDKIGALKTSKLLDKALTVFEDSRPSIIQEERQKVANGFTPEKLTSFDTLDQEFYKYEDDISSLVLAYAERNRSDFGK